MVVENPLNLRQRAALAAGLSERRFPSLQTLPLTFGTRAAARNNSLATATVLPVVPPNLRRTFRDQVGQSDRVDYFKLMLIRKGNVDITLSNRSEARLSGALLDASGKVFSYRGNRQSAAVAAGGQLTNAYKGLTAGVYYVRLQSTAAGSNRYELTLALRADPQLTPLPCGCGA